MKNEPAKPFAVIFVGDHFTRKQEVGFVVWFILAMCCSGSGSAHAPLFFVGLGILFVWNASLSLHTGLHFGRTPDRRHFRLMALPVLLALLFPAIDWRLEGREPHPSMQSFDCYASIALFMILSTYPWYALGIAVARRPRS